MFGVTLSLRELTKLPVSFAPGLLRPQLEGLQQVQKRRPGRGFPSGSGWLVLQHHLLKVNHIVLAGLVCLGCL